MNRSELAMESIIENQRKLHEERERTGECIISELIYKKNGHRENVNSEHRVKLLLDVGIRMAVLEMKVEAKF